MTSATPKTRYIGPDLHDDPLGLSVTAQNPAQLRKTQRDSIATLRKGLFAINGITPEADSAVDFFLGWLLGSALMLEKAYYDASMVEMERLEATVPEPVMREARRMVRTYEAGMKDAERTIRAGCVQQLELDLTGVELDW